MGCSPMTALEMADEAVGAQVRAIRLSRGMSLRSLARAISVSPATLSQIENGRTGLTVSRLRDIAAAMQVSVAQILDTVVSDPDGEIAKIYKEVARKVAVKVAQRAKDYSSRFPTITISKGT